MRILIVTNNYTPYSGGVVSSLNALIPELQRAGHEVLLVAPQFLLSHSNDPAWVYRLPSLIRFSWHNNRMALPWRMKHHLMKVMESFNPDVVHVQHPFLLGVAARKVARLYGVPIVFTYHTMYEAYAHYVPLPQKFVSRVIIWCVKRFCNTVDIIIAPGNVVRSLLLERGVTTPIKVIPSPLQDVFLRKDQRNNSLDGRLTLLTVGRFVTEKNMTAVLDLYDLLPREHFRLVLIGYGVLYEELQQYAYETLGLLRDDVQFVYKPAQKVIAQWYADADFFIFTSQSDTQGLVLVEAMAGGLPVLALPGPGQQEVIVDGENGFICSSTVELQKKIMILADSPEKINALRHGAHTTAQSYRPEVLVDKVSAVYRQVIKIR